MSAGYAKLGQALGYLGLNFPGIREAARNRPILRSKKRHGSKLDKAFDQHLDDIKPGAQVAYDITNAVPEGDTFVDRARNVLNDPTVYAGSTAPNQSPAVSINPNSDSAMYAHELGHIASQQTDVGRYIASLRHDPAIRNAALASVALVPGAYAAITPGDDDYDEGMAIAALASAPTLLDEGLATRHGLAMMDKAGVRATLGQRGKLAAGLLSYLAPSLMAAGVGTAVGNALDSDV